MGGSSMYHGEQVPLSGRIVRGREDPSQQFASPSGGVGMENGLSPQQAGEQSEHPMDVDNTSDAARRELQFMSPIGGNEMFPSHQGERTSEQQVSSQQQAQQVMSPRQRYSESAVAEETETGTPGTRTPTTGSEPKGSCHG